MAIYIYFFLNALVFVCCKSINYPWSFILLLLQSPILYCGACFDRLSAQQNDNHCKPMPLSLPEACESVYIRARVCARAQAPNTIISLREVSNTDPRMEEWRAQDESVLTHKICLLSFLFLSFFPPSTVVVVADFVFFSLRSFFALRLVFCVYA